MANCLKLIGKRAIGIATVDPTNIFRYQEAYQEAIDISNIDPNITTADLINKGYACLAFGKNVLSYEAHQCFLQAAKMDTLNKYTTEIQCGLERTKPNNMCNCFYVAEQ
jgi:hypothetical protein